MKIKLISMHFSIFGVNSCLSDKFSSFNRHCVYFPPRPVSKKNLQRKYQQGSDKDLVANHYDTNWTVCSQFIDINTVPLSIFARFDYDYAYVGLGY